MDKDAAITKFLALDCKMIQDPAVKKISRTLEDQVRGEVNGFKRAQDALRELLAEATQ